MSGITRARGQVRATQAGRLLLLALALVLAGAGAAAAEDDAGCTTLGPDGCPLQKLSCPLVQPPTIFPVNGVLDTRLTVTLREARCVPLVAQSSTIPSEASVQWATMELRNYASPVTSGGALQGPTWRVRKAILEDPGERYDPVENPIATPGTRLRVLLRNSLPNDPATPLGGCEPALFPVCSDNPTQVCACAAPDGACDPQHPDQFVCDAKDPGRTCRVASISQEPPNCFHGTEVTNLHYHGTHVSPQPHSDYVLLSLYSENQTDPPPPDPAGNPAIAIGTYQTDIAPFPWNQPPGTHWYHPHKHGSTAVQLINGMAGALLIGGELDDFLYGLYGVDPTKLEQLEAFEKVMVVQQIFPEAVFFQAGKKPTGYPPYPLVNGQLIPTLHMRYGEVQRWRFISATSNPATQQTVQLNLDPSAFPGFEVRQIEQDGVQFHPINYVRQPLGNAVDGYEMSPGNRVDLLVRAPDAPADLAPMTFFVTRRVIGEVPDDVRKAMAAQDKLVNLRSGLRQAAAGDDAQTSTGALVRVVVSGVQIPSMQLPSRWPDIPPYLEDQSASTHRVMAFSMPNDTTGGSGQGTPQSKFFIDGLQYSHSCAGATVELGKTEEWRIFNDSAPQHPFHIHINPFQIVSRRWAVDTAGKAIAVHTQIFEPPYPWMDTIALKPGRVNRQSETRMLYEPEDFTGEYVLHCHFLGHEDRGMMTNVQAVCPTTDGTGSSPINFGTPLENGLGDDCQLPPDDAAPVPSCPAEIPHDDMDGMHGGAPMAGGH